MFNKYFFIGLVILFILALFFGLMWKNTYTELKSTEEKLTVANENLDTLKSENDRLVEYLSLKDDKIKEIETEYKERLKNIPKDDCGDMKPSKELLEYLRKNIQ